MATEQKTQRVVEKRKAFKADYQTIPYDTFVWIDEAGCNLNMASTHGWGKKGERVPGLRPARFCPNYTMIGALNSEGISTLMTTNGGTTSEVFLAFVNQFLAPTLKPGQIVVMDNLASHKVKGVKEAIESAGCQVLYLPPYSPDLNPIENCWSKIKNGIKRFEARTYQKLDSAIAWAMEQVSGSDVAGWAQNCGYETGSNLL